MTWADFKEIVDEMLTVNANRRGTEALKARALKNCAADLQRYIRGYRMGHTTIYQAADLTLTAKAMLGALPTGAIPEAFYIISSAIVDGELVDPNCRRNRLDFIPWMGRQRLICEQCDERAYLYSIAPYGDQFLVHPIINDETYLLLVWEGIKSNFADGDNVPFPEDAAEAFAAYVSSRILSLVDKNSGAAAEQMGEYKRLRLSLYRDFQEKLDAEKPDQEYVSLAALPPTLADFGAQDIPFLRLVTQLEGADGDVTALSAIPTVSLSVPYAVRVFIGGNIQTWLLQTGTDATAPGVQRPNDYSDPGNTKVWIIVS
jgi:hypothetical protein